MSDVVADDFRWTVRFRDAEDLADARTSAILLARADDFTIGDALAAALTSAVTARYGKGLGHLLITLEKRNL